MRYLFIIFLGTFVYFAQAQDPLYSQAYVNRMSLNPAFVGNDNGYRAAFGYREQWLAVPSRFYNTSLGVEGSLPQFGAGMGLLFNHSVEGEGFLTNNGVTLQFSKVIGVIDRPEQKLFVYFGGAAGVQQKAINWDKLVFGDQLDPVLGKVAPSAASSPYNARKMYPDFDAGIIVKYRKNKIGQTFGFSSHHLAQPDPSFYGEGAVDLPRKYTLHYIFNFPMQSIFPHADKDIYLGPGFVFQRQSYFQTTMLGSKINYKTVFGGVWYRSKLLHVNATKMDGMIMMIGNKFRLDNNTFLSAAYSYDLTLSGLAANTAGTHEISLVIEYSNLAKREAKKYQNCRDFSTPSERSMPVFDW